MDRDDLERMRKQGPAGEYILPLDEPNPWLRRSTPEEIARIRSRLSPLRFGRLEVQAIIEDDDASWPAVLKKAKPKRLIRPPWLPSSYRPRKLTQVGIEALTALGPHGEGIHGYPTSPVTSLQERRDMLAARYAAHDMISLGHAVEVFGAYYFRRDLVNENRLETDARRRMRRSTNQMEPFDMAKWLAMYRVATLDQILSLDPENGFNNFMLLRELEEHNLVGTSEVRMGEGKISIWFLRPKLWGELKRMYPDMESRGFGPLGLANTRPHGMVRTTGSGHAFDHALVQVDAIQWFIHEAELNQKQVTDLMLDRYLRSEGENQPGHQFLDFRLRIGRPGWISLPIDVEVIGRGSSYRSKAKKAYVASSTIVHRSFSANYRRNQLQGHVSIGR